MSSKKTARMMKEKGQKVKEEENDEVLAGSGDHKDKDQFSGWAGTYPMTPEEQFEMMLIGVVESHQSVYNRCHPLHKVTDYRNHVWQEIATETGFAGEPVELERKWRHMRDRYVRLRKQNKTSNPIKVGDRWYDYYKKMSFLDPFVEHRNRKKRNEPENETKNDNEICPGKLDNESDSGDEDTLQKFYASIISNATVANVTASPIQGSGESCSNPVTSSQPMTSGRKRKFDDVSSEADEEDTEVSLYVRSIAKSLEAMDARTFALARIEISRVLFDCQYGNDAKK
ncbi:unnamed protein product [Caenorhabditis auriculariae]|uniref:MADF domain-containing protein n=1 Tax=Caenorhabditis auriculariae TaxID=2777116 RepID=A0A8S1H3Y8_9PELO|nr:unnamed protein product [Caenorhabditis auriculariae]